MIAIGHAKIDSRTTEGRKVLRLMPINTTSIVLALGLPPLCECPVYSKAALCLMAVVVRLTPKYSHC